MGEVYNRLFRARGWFSRTATSRQWFKSTLVNDPVISASLDATEQPDSAAFDVVQANPITLAAIEAPDVADFSVLVIEPGQVIAILLATEPPDTADFDVSVTAPKPMRPPSSPIRGLPPVNLVKKPKPPVQASLGATEAPDRLAFTVTVQPGEAPLVPTIVPPLAPIADELPPPQAPLLGAIPSPAPIEPVPTHPAAIVATMRATDRPDTVTGSATVTDWAAIDNDFLLLT